ncbi:uncharacterized protein LOC132276950 [Cornus florida]|uniref:uncharacterized protein LOC132276950 n=1 Tax=Cornus florida TaxID=4283 RepID=UPI00289FFB91|nr:uncharacterized protein LOC132276950 [Cornus florida]
MVVAIDYFTKWVEVIPLKTCEQSTVIDFIKKHIIHRFGILETLTTDRGISFVGNQVIDYCSKCGVQVISSTPYFAQANGHVEASNKMTIRFVRVAFQNKLTPADYNHAMLVELEDLDEVCLNVLDHVIAQKKKVMWAYNKKVKAKSFVEGDLVWQVKFSPAVKDNEYGKWTPNWDGPYLVEQVLGK